MSALTAFNRKKSFVNGVEPEKQRRQGRFTENIAALRALNQKKNAFTALNRKNGGVNAV